MRQGTGICAVFLRMLLRVPFLSSRHATASGRAARLSNGNGLSSAKVNCSFLLRVDGAADERCGRGESVNQG